MWYVMLGIGGTAPTADFRTGIVLLLDVDILFPLLILLWLSYLIVMITIITGMFMYMAIHFKPRI